MYILYSRPVVWTRNMHCWAGDMIQNIELTLFLKMEIILVSFLLSSVYNFTANTGWISNHFTFDVIFFHVNINMKIKCYETYQMLKGKYK